MNIDVQRGIEEQRGHKLKEAFNELGKLVFPNKNDERAEDIDLVVRNIKARDRLGKKAIEEIFKFNL